MKPFKIQGKSHLIEAVHSENQDSLATLIIAHGAGAGMNHPFMTTLANRLVLNHIDVIRFNFPYITLGKKFPGSPKPNIEVWKDVIDWTISNTQHPIFISGKSYGGRMASHLLADTEITKIKGIIYFGFPLHAPGRDSIDRANHLNQIKCPQLFLQGDKDALAKFDLIQQVTNELSLTTLKEIKGGDHSFKVKGSKPDEIIEGLATTTSDWIGSNI